MGLDLDYIEGQTPLDEEEKNGLRIPTITTHGELDEFEQKNIEEAIQWIMGRSFNPAKVFSEDFVQTLHNRMYGDVWTWAGGFRKSNKNLGIDYWQIQTSLRQLLDDANYQYKNNTYAPDEMAIRFKHRIVSIHCFPNGNGRHSRLMADIIIEKLYKQSIFSWGATNLKKVSETRKEYITSVKAADKGDYSLLLDFARS